MVFENKRQKILIHKIIYLNQSLNRLEDAQSYIKFNLYIKFSFESLNRIQK
jgi:hypothetical protein